jgi:hypothetical protein
MSKLTKALTAAAGNAGGDNLYVEDVFSTYLYTGNSSTQTITNDIDLAGEGGLVWLKKRNGASNNIVSDTERGITNTLNTDGTNAQNTITSTAVSSVQSDGFTLQNNGDTNQTGGNYASWTFRKAEKFFDIVTFTGDGNSSNLISHNLGSTPAFMIMKRTDGNSGWMTAASDGAGNYKAAWNLNSTAQSYVTTPISTVSTDSTVDVGYWNPNWDGAANLSGATYVLYLFASDAGGFGDDGSENIIKCGSFTGASNINLGYEPQWILLKRSDGVNDWRIFDTMRGWLAGSDTASVLSPNLSNAELSSGFDTKITSTGFTTALTGTYIYIAIRRPMKTPESGTEVYTNVEGSGADPAYVSGFVTDLGIRRYPAATQGNKFYSRLTGGTYLDSTSTAAQVTDANGKFDYMDAWFDNPDGSGYYGWSFKRATGFFDVVAYTGTGVARTVNHNLGVVPELMILKVRNRAGSSWVGYHKDLGNEGGFSLTNFAAFSGVTSAWNSTTPTSSVFTVGTGSNYNGNTDNLIAYLFATLAGVSKVGSYTGTGSNVNVDCGFSAGARFILIKRTDSTGDWYVWDSARGIVAGNDSYLLLNSTAAEVTGTDYIDPLSSGFTVTSSAPAALNASGGTYIFLAIA